MNGYELSRNWFNWSFDNPEKIKPIHSAIFFFAVEHQNRLGGKETFGFPSQMTMDAIGIRKYQTYGKALNDLVDWGFILMVEKSRNQYSANIIQLCAPTKNGIARGKALDKAMIKHKSKLGQSKEQSKDSINKPLTNKPLTNKPENKDVLSFDLIKIEQRQKLDVYLMHNKKLVNEWNNLVTSFNNKMELELAQNKISFTSEELFPRFKMFCNSWINNQDNTKPNKPKEIDLNNPDDDTIVYYWKHEGRSLKRSIHKDKAKKYFDNQKIGGYIPIILKGNYE